MPPAAAEVVFPAAPRAINLGRMEYERAYAEQELWVARIIEDRARAAREHGCGVLLLVEHPPVITVSRRAGAGAHLLASPAALAAAGVEVRETDRGGDITYHGPGQQVVYPILDLNLLNLGLHEYMRTLEQAVIDTLAGYGVVGERDPGATGVWVGGEKICAMGVRVRRWVSMHGLALNVTTDLSHFGFIVPCGLVGRGVTSLRTILADGCPALDDVGQSLTANLARLVVQAGARASEMRRAAAVLPPALPRREGDSVAAAGDAQAHDARDDEAQ
ncbi:MAG: lipoyl(octanoyl) transferase LipB [Phycisphaeraceae bacterium]|nr:lipoyl(octanoyl) transferase LipB [Phycisphaeraceae bacterium]